MIRVLFAYLSCLSADHLLACCYTFLIVSVYASSQSARQLRILTDSAVYITTFGVASTNFSTFLQRALLTIFAHSSPFVKRADPSSPQRLVAHLQKHLAAGLLRCKQSPCVLWEIAGAEHE